MELGLNKEGLPSLHTVTIVHRFNFIYVHYLHDYNTRCMYRKYQANVMIHTVLFLTAVALYRCIGTHLMHCNIPVLELTYLTVVVCWFSAHGSHCTLATKAAATSRHKGSLDWRETASGRNWTDQSDASKVVATETGRPKSWLSKLRELVAPLVLDSEDWSLVLNLLPTSRACLNQKTVSDSHREACSESTCTRLERLLEELCSGEKAWNMSIHIM